MRTIEELAAKGGDWISVEEANAFRPSLRVLNRYRRLYDWNGRVVSMGSNILGNIYINIWDQTVEQYKQEDAEWKIKKSIDRVARLAKQYKNLTEEERQNFHEMIKQ